ncbi:MAG: FAD-dependent oxidoreductase [Phycisphaerales bacterium]|nr:FAD-dependent oxidoreductase [Phycisphaerales bacterium]
MKTIDDYDVIILGGGPGGFGAAVRAGRAGEKTLLIEREGCLGGGGTTMLVNPFMPHTTDCWQKTGEFKVVNAGVYAELLQALTARRATNPNDPRRFDDESLRVVLDEMISAAGVKVIFHATLFDAKTNNGRIESVRLAHNGGPLTVRGKVFIDATGDSLLAALVGCDVMFGDEQGNGEGVMPMTTNFLVGGVDLARVPSAQELKARAARGDKDTPALINTNVSCTSYCREGTMHFNAIRITGNMLDPFELSGAEMEGRRRIENFVAWLKANVPGYENCWLIKVGQHIGIRESRRIRGDYLLTGEDILACRKFDDAISCCAYPVDIHGQNAGECRITHLPAGEYYQIPFRCLTPRGTTNLLVASRGISADVVAHGSLRIMPSVMNIGEAAGEAAVISLPAGEVRYIDVQELQKKIVAAGGVLVA